LEIVHQAAAQILAIAGEGGGSDIIACFDHRCALLPPSGSGNSPRDRVESAVRALAPCADAFAIAFKSADDLRAALEWVNKHPPRLVVLIEDDGDNAAIAIVLAHSSSEHPAVCSLVCAVSTDAGPFECDGGEIALLDVGDCCPPLVGSFDVGLAPRTVVTSGIAELRNRLHDDGVKLRLAGLVNASMCLYDRRLPNTGRYAALPTLTAWASASAKDARLDLPAFVIPWTTGARPRHARVILPDICLTLREPVTRRTDWRQNGSVAPWPGFLACMEGQPPEGVLRDFVEGRGISSGGVGTNSATICLFGETARGRREAAGALACKLSSRPVTAALHPRSGSFVVTRPIGNAGIAFVYPGLFSAYMGFTERLFDGLPTFQERCRVIFGPDIDRVLSSEVLYPRGADVSRRGSAPIAPLRALIVHDVFGHFIYTLVARDYLGLRPVAGIGISLGALTMVPAMDGTPELLKSWMFVEPSLPTRIAELIGAGGTAATDEGEHTWFVACRTEAAGRAVESDDRLNLIVRCTPTRLIVKGLWRDLHRLTPGQVVHFSRVKTGANDLHTSAVARFLPDWLELIRCRTADHRMDRLKGIDFYTGSRAIRMAASPEALLSLWEGVLASLTAPVDLPAMVQAAYRRGIRIFIVCGPGRHAADWIDQTLGDMPHLAVPLAPEEMDAWQGLQSAAALLRAHGVCIDGNIGCSPGYERTFQ